MAECATRRLGYHQSQSAPKRTRILGASLVRIRRRDSARELEKVAARQARQQVPRHDAHKTVASSPPCCSVRSRPGVIDGALVAREDPTTPWRGVPFVATSREQILQAGGSFYNQTMALGALDLTKVGLGETGGRVAVVGTPCEIQGIRAMQRSSFRTGVSQVDAIVFTIALLCTKSFDYKRLMVDAIATKRSIPLSEVGKVDVIHGRLIVEDKKGATLVDEAIKDFHHAALKGCDECADFLGRGADLSVGSVGSEAGYSSILVRTPVGAAALDGIRDELEIEELSRPEALVSLDRLDKKIAFSSLRRPLDPDGPLFIDFADHLAGYEDTDRAPVWRSW